MPVIVPFNQDASTESGVAYSEFPLVSANELGGASEYKTFITGIAIFVLFVGVVALAAVVLVATLDDGRVYSDDVGSNPEGKDDSFRDSGATSRRRATPRRLRNRPNVGGGGGVKVPHGGGKELAPLPPQLMPVSAVNKKEQVLLPDGVDADRVAADLLNSALDWSYSPCSNFYDFVCSKFNGPLIDVLSTSNYHTREESKAMLYSLHVPGRNQRAVEKAAGLYQACVRLGSSHENSEVESLRSFLSALGLDAADFPEDPNFDIPDRITRLSLEYGFSTFVRFGYTRRPHIAKKVLDMQIHTLDEEWMENNHHNYDNASLARLYEDYVRLYEPSLDAAALVSRVIRSEFIVRRAIEKVRTYQRTVSTLVNELGKFTRGYVSKGRWEELITQYTRNLFTATDTVVLWDNPGDIVVLLMDKNRMAPEDSRLLMAWSLLHQLLPLAHGQAMITLALSQYRLQDPIGDFCLESVRGIMSLPITKHYLRYLVPPSAVEEARQVVGDLKETLLEKIKNSDWIKDTMWCLMFGKARNMRLITGYPKEFATESLVENFYAGFPTTGPSDFFTPYFESHRILTTRFHTENVTDNFTTGVATAFYNGGRNKVIILPDLLKPPVFIHGGPAAINYGGLGQAVGHEMMHGFDVGNIEFSYQNSKRDLQRTWTMREYNKKVLCLRASYQRAETHSRARTLDEHIDSEGFADFAGVLLAYEAYRRLPDHVLSRAVPHVGLNADQLFFVFHCLKWCSTTSERRRDPASPYWRSRSRCIVPLQNMPEFAKAFYCKQGDLMNPAERCSFW